MKGRRDVVVLTAGMIGDCKLEPGEEQWPLCVPWVFVVCDWPRTIKFGTCELPFPASVSIFLKLPWWREVPYCLHHSSTLQQSASWRRRHMDTVCLEIRVFVRAQLLSHSPRHQPLQWMRGLGPGGLQAVVNLVLSVSNVACAESVQCNLLGFPLRREVNGAEVFWWVVGKSWQSLGIFVVLWWWWDLANLLLPWFSPGPLWCWWCETHFSVFLE